LRSVLEAAGGRLIDAVFPWRCVACDAGGAPRAGLGRWLCLGCEEGLPWIADPCRRCGTPSPPHLGAQASCRLCSRVAKGIRRSYVLWRHEGAAKHFRHAIKFQGRPELVAAAGRRLGAIIEDRPEVLMPVPSHWLRRLMRGFNQAELLAQELGKDLSLPVQEGLRRRRATAPLYGKTRLQRKSLLEGALELRAGATIKGRHVLLVDDLRTSGTTLGACAELLRQGGARRVDAALLSVAERS